MKVGVIGTCLSNLTAVMLVSEYRWERLNNAACFRSDVFLSNIVHGAQLPDIEEMRRFFGITPGEHDDGDRMLKENYRAHGGMTELDMALPRLWKNLEDKAFDVILLDNLGDTQSQTMRYSGPAYEDFAFFMPLHLGANADAVAPFIRVDPHLSPAASAENWVAIIKWLLKTQPQARIIFTCAQYCTCVTDPDRYDRAYKFYDEFMSRARDLPIEIIPPIVVPQALMKLPDADHFDMSIYRGLAGHVYIGTIAGWHGANQQIKREVPSGDFFQDAGNARGPDVKTSPLRLHEIVAAALGIDPAKIDETSGMDRTENWDSLKQINLLMEIEERFGTKLAFKDITHARTMPLIRQALLRAGVRAADHGDAGVEAPEAAAETQLAATDAPGHVLAAAYRPERGLEQLIGEGRNLFVTFAERALADPQSHFGIFVKDEAEQPLENGWVLACAADIASRLAGQPAGGIVAIVLDHSPHLYTAFIGCVMAGLVPTILPPMTPRQDPQVFRESIEVLFDRIKPVAVVTSAAAGANLPAGHLPRILDADITPLAEGEAAAFARRAIAFDAGRDTAFLQHSSGTTGHKKGVMLSHAQVLEQARLYAQAIGLEPGERVASWLPLYHDMGLLTSFIIPAIVGVPIISLDAQEWVMQPSLLLQYIEKYKANYAWLPNFAFHHTVKGDFSGRTWDLSSVKMLVNCSEPCREAAFAAFAERYGAMGIGREKLQVSYAMAENVFAVTQTPAGGMVGAGHGAAGHYLSAGKVLPGVELVIRGTDGMPVPAGEVGEITFRSSCMFSGYANLPEVTRERIRDGWYYSKDLGVVQDEDLYVVGRLDDLILVNGKNIIAHEIEDIVSLIPGVAPGRVLVAGVFDEAVGTNKIMVLVELTPETQPDPEIERAIRASVFSHCAVAPSSVVLLPRGYLIKSTSGKLARARSLEKYMTEQEAVTA